MKRNITKFFLGFFLMHSFIFLSGCGVGGPSAMERKEIASKSSEFAVDYLKKEIGIDFEVEEVEFATNPSIGVVFVRGHDAKTNEKYDVQIDYQDNYRIAGYGFDK